MKPGVTREWALRHLRNVFAEAGIDTAALDARLLLSGVLKLDPALLITHPDALVTEAEAEAITTALGRRLAHEPVARILGEREFWSLPFEISPATLIPRPDTETVVETALQLVPDHGQNLDLVDFGTGSGCILTALLHELPQARGLGIDRSFEALLTARRNARRNGVGDRASFAASDWADALSGHFDLIVSNPPYIATGTISGLDPEVRDYDPKMALDGGVDGLAAYRILLKEAKRLLKPGGLTVLEIGYDQAEALQELAGTHGFAVLALAYDLGGQPRCLALKQT